MPLKSYSPELIVFPILEPATDVQQFEAVLDRATAVVIGPGLGRDASTIRVAKQIFDLARQRNLPVVIDGVSGLADQFVDDDCL